MNEVTILKFYADWCSPCRVLNLKLDGYELPIEAINIDLNQELVAQYSIRSVPTMVFIDSDKNELSRLVGVRDGKEVESILTNLRNGDRTV